MFIDEINTRGIAEWIEQMIPLVDYLWIVPSTDSLKSGLDQELSQNLFFLDLKRNFRNCQEVAKAAISVAEKKGYHYKEGIAIPLGNFPGGCAPLFVDSFESAVKEARKRTNDGILVIIDGAIGVNVDGYFHVLDQINENVKAYHVMRNDFEERENPYKFLQEGNVLIIDERLSLGFEWSTVIVVTQVAGYTTTLHDCNYMMRCTTNLIVVKR